MMKDKITQNRNLKNLLNPILLITVILIILFAFKMSLDVIAAPEGASIIFNTTENATVRQAESHTAGGGSFTTLILNVTSQTSKWKAYVGNVTGKLTLDNSNNKTIYDWTVTSVQGEVYVSRNNSVTFSTIACANSGNITSEESSLSINSTSDDSINKTFTQRRHKTFVVGGVGTIQNSTCLAIATYINDTTQAPSESATFQEVLLSDGTNMVFTTILNDDQQGFDGGNYDFQIIVPDNPTEVSTTYYFYAELG